MLCHQLVFCQLLSVDSGTDGETLLPSMLQSLTRNKYIPSEGWTLASLVSPSYHHLLLIIGPSPKGEDRDLYTVLDMYRHTQNIKQTQSKHEKIARG